MLVLMFFDFHFSAMDLGKDLPAFYDLMTAPGQKVGNFVLFEKIKKKTIFSNFCFVQGGYLYLQCIIFNICRFDFVGVLCEFV